MEEEIDDVVTVGWNQGGDVDVVQRLSSCASELERWNKLKRKESKDEKAGYLEKMETYSTSHDPESTARFFKAQREYNRVLMQEETF